MTMTTEEAVTALQASCLPCELAAAREEMPVEELSENVQKWEGILTYEGQATGDGRIIQPNALRWDTLPIPLRWVQSDAGGHDGAIVVGRINAIERRDDGAIYGYGDFDMESEAGREAARQVEKGLTSGVSVDLDDVSFEVRVASEASEFVNEEVELAAEEPDENGRVKVASQKPDDELMITTDARMRAATLLAIPAFEPARISLAAASIDREGKWHSPLNGEYIDMPGKSFVELFLSLGGDPLNLEPKFEPFGDAVRNMDSAIRNKDIDALNDAERAFVEAANADPDTHKKLLRDSNFAESIDAVEAAIDNGSFGEEDTSLNEELDEEERAAQDAEDAEIKTVGDFLPEAIKQIDDANPTESEKKQFPPNGMMEEFLVEKGYGQDVVDSLTQEELEADFENEGGFDSVDEADLVEHNQFPPNDIMEDYLISKGYERDVVESLTQEELEKDFEDEGGFDDAKFAAQFNWVEDTGTGHLPQYIKRIAKHLKKKGMTEGHAIATAVNAVKKMCATGDINFPGKQQVNVGSQAEACEAVAEWEAKKAQAKADAAETEEFRDVSTKERERLAEEGEALSDGSFPIANCGDLKNAIQAIGRAKDPAAARAHIKKRAGELDCDVELPESITAAAFPLQPPSAWFADPGLDGPTPLKVTPDGRVYGHLAVWGTCHTAFPGQCVTPPTSPSNYSYFRTGSVYTAEGTEQNTGVITMDTLHAGKSLSAVSTLAHYEHTGRAIADVNAGEDAYGIWVAGALRPGATDDQVRALRGAPLSGDWRKIGSSGLELVAALAVNVPGFPIPRPQGLAAGGAMQALVAAGMLAPTPPTRAARRNQRKSLSDEDYAYLKRLADRERALVEAETAQMAREVLASDLASSIGL